MISKWLTKNRGLILIIITGLVFSTWGINSWKFSFVGDEWPFYSYAVDIANGAIPLDVFKLDGVYGYHPIMGSLWPALFIKLFGSSNFVWRLSVTILIVPITIYFYFWVKELFGKTHAIFSTILLVCSAFIANYLKIGYNNSISFTLFIVSIYYATLVGKSGKYKDAILLGIFLGFGFYIYLGPLVPFFITPLVLPLLIRDRTRAIRSYALMVFISLSIISIGFLLREIPPNYFSKSILEPEFTSNIQILRNISHNFLVFFNNYDFQSNHFIDGPYFDYLSQLLIVCAICITLLRRKTLSILLVITTYIVTAVLIGVTSPYSYSPITRGVFLIPFGALFGGITLTYLYEKKHAYMKYIAGVIVCLVFILNFYQSQYGVFATVGHHYNAYILQELQLIKSAESNQSVTAILPVQAGFNTSNMDILQQAYGLESINFSFSNFDDISCNNASHNRLLLRSEDISQFTNRIQTRCPTVGTIIPITNYYFY